MAIDRYGYINNSYGGLDYRTLQEIEMRIDQAVRERVDAELTKQRQQALYYPGYYPHAAIMSLTYSAQEAKQQEETRKAKISSFTSAITSLGAAAPVMITKQSPMPDYTATLVGWRAWKVKGGKLCALSGNTIWEAGGAKAAECNNSSTHPCPTKDCTCGYWSFHSLDILHKALEAYIDSVMVIGPTEVWGRVIECENGFRSEYAYPKELWLLKDGLEHLSWEYGVPVRKMEKK